MKKLLMVLLALTLAACAKSELHNAMETMGDALKAVGEAESPAEMQTHLNEVLAALKIARQQQVKPEHQQTFDEGLEKVQELFDQFQGHLLDGEPEMAKGLFPKLKETIEHYHEELGVD